MTGKLPQSKKRLLLLIAAAAEIILLLFGFLQDRKTGAETVLLADAFSSVQDGITQDGEGVHVPETISGYAVTSRWLELDSGLYNVTVAYTGGGASIAFHDQIAYIKAGEIPLPAGQNAVTFQAYIYAPQEHATLRLTMDGGTAFTLQSVTLTPSRAWAWYNLLRRLVFFAALDLALALWFGLLPICRDPHRLALWGGVVATAALASVPLLTDILLPGHDLLFHLNRIEGLAQGMMDGQFPVKIQPFWLMGRGYATSVFYGDLFLYFPAVLRFFGVSVQGAYKCYVVAVNLATAAISYYCFGKMLQNRWAGLLGAMLYTLSGYRLISLYTRAAVGEYTAMTFLPLIAYGLWLIYRQPRDAKAPPLLWVPAALGYAGVINCHILSCEMVGFLMLLTCVVLLPRTLRKNTFFSLVKVVLGTAALCLWFLVPFLDYMRGSYLVMSANIPDSLQISGAFWTQLLGVFSRSGTNVFGMDAFAGTGNEMSFTLGFSLVLGAALFFLCTAAGADRKSSVWRMGSLCFWLGLLCAWFSTVSFPWDTLCAQFPIVKRLVGTMQYIWRFLSPASLFLSVTAACAVVLLWPKKSARNLAAVVLAVFCLVNWGSVVQSGLEENGSQTYYSAAALNPNRIQTGEYLPTGADRTLLMTPREITAEDTVRLDDESGLIIDRLHVTVGCQTDQGGTVTVPLLYYPYYQATDLATGETLPLSHTEDSFEITVTLPAGYHGNFTVAFHEPLHWRLAEVFSLVSAIALCGYAVHLRRQKKIA